MPQRRAHFLLMQVRPAWLQADKESNQLGCPVEPGGPLETYQHLLLAGSQAPPKTPVAAQTGRGEVSPRSAPTAEAVVSGAAACVLDTVKSPVTVVGTSVGRAEAAAVTVASRSRRPLQTRETVEKRHRRSQRCRHDTAETPLPPLRPHVAGKSHSPGSLLAEVATVGVLVSVA